MSFWGDEMCWTLAVFGVVHRDMVSWAASFRGGIGGRVAE